MKRFFLLFIISIFLMFEILIFFSIGKNAFKEYIGVFFVLNAFLLLYTAIADRFLVFLLSFAFLPFNVYKPLCFEIGIVNFSVFALIIWPLFFITFISIFFRKQAYYFGPLDALIIILSLLYIVAVFRAPDFISAGFISYQTFFLPVATYFVIKANINTKRKYDTAFYCFTAVVTFIAVYGIIVFGKTRLRIEVFDLKAIATGTLFTYVVYHYIFSSFYRKKWMLVVFIICLIAAFLSMSRVIILMLLAAIFLFRRFQTVAASRLLVSAVLVSLLLTFAIPMSLKPTKMKEIDQDRVKSIDRMIDLDFYKYNAWQRLLTWQDGMRLIKHKPLLGYSPGELGESGWHNIFLEVTYWIGGFGLVFFLFIVLYPFFFDFTKLSLSNMYFINLYMLFALIVNGLTNGYHGFPPLFIFVLIGLCEAMKRVDKESASMEG